LKDGCIVAGLQASHQLSRRLYSSEAPRPLAVFQPRYHRTIDKIEHTNS
jgi:hypothetical protein